MSIDTTHNSSQLLIRYNVRHHSVELNLTFTTDLEADTLELNNLMSKLSTVMKSLSNPELKLDAPLALPTSSPSLNTQAREEHKKKKKLSDTLKEQIQTLLDMPDDLEVLISERRFENSSRSLLS